MSAPRTTAECDAELGRLTILRRPLYRVANVARLRDWLEQREAAEFARIAAAQERRARARYAQFETASAEAW